MSGDRLDAALDELGAAIRAQVQQPPPVVVPPPPPPPPEPVAGVDLTRWKLTIPEVKDGKVVEIKPPGLARYTDRYFAPVEGGLRFRCWHGGGTTSGSANPRSELRELNADGSLAKWSTTSGRHELVVDGQVNRLTLVKPHTVLAQIHGGDDDVTVFRLEGTKLWITKGDDTHAFLVTDRLWLTQRYQLRLVAEQGTVRYWFNGQPVDYALQVKDSSCYFKAGNYLQSNAKTAPGESTDEYSEVIVFGAQVTHS